MAIERLQLLQNVGQFDSVEHGLRAVITKPKHATHSKPPIHLIVSFECRLPLKMINGFDPSGGSTALTKMRSEEHTSELQSLMRISYAVFCLKKTKTPIIE